MKPLPVVAEGIVLNARPVIRVKQGPYLVGAGYFDSPAAVAAALTAAGIPLAALTVRSPR